MFNKTIFKALIVKELREDSEFRKEIKEILKND
jgi:hypothetical protein